MRGLRVGALLPVLLISGVVQVRATVVGVFLHREADRAERLRAEAGRQVFQCGQVLVHDLLGAQLALAHSVLLKATHKLGEDAADTQLGEEVVL